MTERTAERKPSRFKVAKKAAISRVKTAFSESPMTMVSSLPLLGASSYLFSTGDVISGLLPLAAEGYALYFDNKGRSAIKHDLFTDDLVGRKSTERFMESINEGVTLLQEHLGISFPDGKETKEIPLHGKNRRTYMMRHPFKAIDKDEKIIYDDTYNAIFVKDGANRETILRRTIQAYFRAKNPKLFREKEYQTVKSENVNGTGNRFNAEKYVAHTFFCKSLEAWMLTCMTYVMSEKGEDWPSLLSSRTRRDIIESRTEGIDETTEFAAYFPAYDRLQQHVDSLGRAKTWMGKISAYEKMVKDTQVDYVGSLFVLEVMDIFRENNFSISDAVDRFITNPPDTIADLQDSQKFARNKLGLMA